MIIQRRITLVASRQLTLLHALLRSRASSPTVAASKNILPSPIEDKPPLPREFRATDAGKRGIFSAQPSYEVYFTLNTAPVAKSLPALLLPA